MKYLLSLFGTFIFITSTHAFTLSGNVKEKNGKPLPFSSLLIKGTSKGTTANAKGFFSIDLEQGNYTIVCQHVGFATIEKTISITTKDVQLDFVLELQQYTLKEVIVQKGEDPAYEIIRNAIQKRPEYLKEIKKFECEVYIKGQLQLRDFPKKFFGQKVDFEDGDTSKRKMLFLSETLAKYSVEEPDKRKVEVISTKVSGNSDGFGFSSPQIISFYENIITLGRGLNPRGFVSPISNNALNFYRFKYDGSFIENGREINHIKVIPKRKYEPLFSGYINIIENEWRIHSVELTILKEQQMQFLDTLKIEQQYVPLKDKWVIKQQVLYPAGKLFAFDFFGNFVQVYDKFNIEPEFAKKFFNNTIIKFYDSSNKKPMAYWDSIRPLPLSVEEKRDYKKKDSLEIVRNDPKYLDSLDRKANKVSITGILLTGESFSKRKKKETIRFDALLSTINYNTVEGPVVNISPTYFRSYAGRQSLSITPTLRYGFGNQRFNAHLNTTFTFGKKYPHFIRLSGGRRIFQFNNEQPITPRDNTYATLLYARNFMKIYEAGFLRAGFSAGLGDGFTIGGSFQWQHRMPLDNLTEMTRWRKLEGREFTPNYPYEITNTNLTEHQASIATINISWRPGSKYIELPERKINIGSKYPTFALQFIQGIQGLLGSDVNYSKWRFSVNDNLNLKLGGRFSYRVNIGGFLNDKQVFIPDYQHFQGNRTAMASEPLNSFQLAPYYRYSNTAQFYTTIHAEYHLNGLLTNKIPLMRKWNWFLLIGSNAFYVNRQTHYIEGFLGIENIFKIFRVDFVQGYLANGQRTSGIRFTTSVFASQKEE